jgi:hypothetical protein
LSSRDVLETGSGGQGRRGPLVVAIDGRSASGKTTLADRLQQAVPAAQIVHTDDIAWFHSRFDWADALVTGILQPLIQGRDVHYRPPGWVLRDRRGEIEVSALAKLVIVEGLGSSRRELSAFIDYAIWVQSDEASARHRGVLRDRVALGYAADDEWQSWQDEEVPFLLADEPWRRADVVVGGTDQVEHDRATEVLWCQRERSDP